METTMIEGFKKVCPFCKRVFESTSKGMVEHNYNEHLRACKKKDKKIEEKK